jgi:hypothetical protein
VSIATLLIVVSTGTTGSYAKYMARNLIAAGERESLPYSKIINPTISERVEFHELTRVVLV